MGGLSVKKKEEMSPGKTAAFAGVFTDPSCEYTGKNLARLPTSYSYRTRVYFLKSPTTVPVERNRE